jgi:hypothetical protein|tara:strand:- start:340 stop:924 length:585 start_codon:yes stop_codon:yes gene_type:complete
MIKKNEDFKSLILIIESILGVDVTKSKSRKRHVVNAKMIFSFLLHKKGYGCSIIAEALFSHHATVLYYFKKVPGHLKYDSKFRNEYEAIQKEDHERTLSNLEMRVFLADAEKTAIDLKMEILALTTVVEQQEVENLRLSGINEIQAEASVRLQKNLKNSIYTETRLFSLYELIKTRTPEGSEKKMLLKLNRLYN